MYINTAIDITFSILSLLTDGKVNMDEKIHSTNEWYLKEVHKMALQKFNLENENNNHDLWIPQEIGESISGNVCDIVVDEFNNDVAVILTEDGVETMMPSHKALLGYYQKFEIGQYVHIELKNIVGSYKKRIYSVQIDPDKFIDFDVEAAD